MENIPVRYIYTGSKELGSFETFSIRNIQDLLHGEDMVQELHRHDFFYILALEKGEGNHEIDFKSYQICDNSVFFMRPGQVHQLVLKAGSKGYLMEFKPDFYYCTDQLSSQIFRKASKMNHSHSDENRFRKLLSVLTYIFQEFTTRQENYQEVIKANLDIFFIELVRQDIKKHPDDINLYTQGRLEEFLELLETHVINYKQVSQYAELLNLSIYQLNAITKSTLGKRCSVLINEYIILESKRYLLATTSQVSQIAAYLGYEDVSYFIRFFKKHTGYSPEVFRSKYVQTIRVI